MTVTRVCECSFLFQYCVIGFVWASYKWIYTLSGAMLAKWLTSFLLFSFRHVYVCVWLYIFCQRVTVRLVLLCDLIYCSHSMYNAYPKLYVTCLSAFFLPSPNKGDHTFECTGAGTRMLYLAVYKTNFSQIYDFWSQVISPNPQTGHNSRPLYVIPALFSNLRAVALQECQGSCKEKPSIFSAAHFLFSLFFIH